MHQNCAVQYVACSANYSLQFFLWSYVHVRVFCYLLVLYDVGSTDSDTRYGGGRKEKVLVKRVRLRLPTYLTHSTLSVPHAIQKFVNRCMPIRRRYIIRWPAFSSQVKSPQAISSQVISPHGEIPTLLSPQGEIPTKVKSPQRRNPHKCEVPTT